MFRKLYKGIFGLWIVAIALISAAIGVGHLRHNPMAILFTNPDGTPCEMPCLFGIRPGETTLTEAMALIQFHPATDEMREFLGAYLGEPVGGMPHDSEDYNAIGVATSYIGYGGRAAVISIYTPQDWVNTAYAYRDHVAAICLSQSSLSKTPDIPLISAELMTLWDRSSFLQMLGTLGVPQGIRLPSFGLPLHETYYFNNHLVIIHQRDIRNLFDTTSNFFVTLCLYEQATSLDYERTIRHPLNPTVPWLGIYATAEDYAQWLIDHPPTPSAP
ncbi:MAG: hypothetical protein U0670_18855 [Anaerolineae bacterium]